MADARALVRFTTNAVNDMYRQQADDRKLNNAASDAVKEAEKAEEKELRAVDTGIKNCSRSIKNLPDRAGLQQTNEWFEVIELILTTMGKPGHLHSAAAFSSVERCDRKIQEESRNNRYCWKPANVLLQESTAPVWVEPEDVSSSQLQTEILKSVQHERDERNKTPVDSSDDETSTRVTVGVIDDVGRPLVDSYGRPVQSVSSERTNKSLRRLHRRAFVRIGNWLINDILHKIPSYVRTDAMANKCLYILCIFFKLLLAAQVEDSPEYRLSLVRAVRDPGHARDADQAVEKLEVWSENNAKLRSLGKILDREEYERALVQIVSRISKFMELWRPWRDGQDRFIDDYRRIYNRIYSWCKQNQRLPCTVSTTRATGRSQNYRALHDEGPQYACLDHHVYG